MALELLKMFLCDFMMVLKAIKKHPSLFDIDEFMCTTTNYSVASSWSRGLRDVSDP